MRRTWKSHASCIAFGVCSGQAIMHGSTRWVAGQVACLGLYVMAYADSYFASQREQERVP